MKIEKLESPLHHRDRRSHEAPVTQEQLQEEIKVLLHESPFVRMGFVSGLREIQESGGDIDHLVSGYTTDSDERVRKAACEVLEWNS